MKNTVKENVTRMMAGFVMAATVAAAAVPANVQACTSSNAYEVDVDYGYLALRNATSYDEANELGALYDGEIVYVSDYLDGDYWFVEAPSLGMFGYVNCNYLLYRGEDSCDCINYFGPTEEEYTEYFETVNSSLECEEEGYRDAAPGTWSVYVEKGYLALRTWMAFDDANEIGRLHTGDVVVVENTATGNPDYWWVYVPSLNMSGYVNCNFLF